MARIRREEVAFPSSPDPRFGGNMARATEGAQYRGSPRDYYGGPSKGSPMHDARYGNYMAPHRVDYTRNAPPQSSGTPNFRPPYGAPGKPSYNEWLQQIDPYADPYPPKKHPNPRMRGIGGGLESLQSKINLQDIFNRFPGMNLWKLIKQLDKRGIEYAGNDTGIGSTDEYLKAELGTPQLDWMEGPYGNPGGGGYSEGASGWDAYKSNVNKYEDKGGILPWWLGGRSPQEPATDQEIMDQLKRNIRNKKWGRDTPSQVSPNWRVTT